MIEGKRSRIQPLKRGMYFISLFGSMFLFVGVGLIVDGLIRGKFDGQPGIVLVIPMVLWWVYAIYISVRRLRDVCMSAWWLAALFVPFLNIYVAFKLIFGGSTKETKF